jgi:hypothetical protein
LGHGTQPSQAAIRAEVKVRLQEALNGMGPLDREVLALRHFEQLSPREAAEVVMHFWGVKANTVWQWREALGVPQYNPGTTALKSELLSPWLDEIRRASIAVAGSAERREKIAASRRGKP